MGSGPSPDLRIQPWAPKAPESMFKKETEQEMNGRLATSETSESSPGHQGLQDTFLIKRLIMK